MQVWPRILGFLPVLLFPLDASLYLSLCKTQ
uniref:Uncharacterized protein n=1 Tax=Rhizophora mucronata TaxID=61149 RepID=A0A2P2QVW9_RHIMU